MDSSPQQEIYLYWLGGVRSNGSCFLRDAAAAPADAAAMAVVVVADVADVAVVADADHQIKILR